MAIEALSLNKQEKKKTAVELAIDHINSESEKAEGELKKAKFIGRLLELAGGAALGISVFSAYLLLSNEISPDLSGALRDLDLGKLIQAPGGKILISSWANLLTGNLAVHAGTKMVSEAIAKAKEKKNHILSQYIGRIETPPRT